MSIQKDFWGVLVCVIFLGGMAFAQVTTGTILGTVSDSTGAVIPGATVTIRNVDTGMSRTVTADAAGRYRAPQLGLGNYEVSAETAGFQTTVRSGIELTVGREAVVDFTLQVGAVSERITVTGEAPLIETTNATVSSLVNEQTMRDLPLNGRSFTDLAVIQPGVVDTNIGSSTSPVFTGGRRFSINGARPQQSLYLLDGTDIVAPYENVAPNSVLGQFLGVETTREFSVIQTNAGAQYGRAMGGIINAVTRSGTNELHGGAFEFFRNEALDANDFFLNRADSGKQPLKQNQFGGTLGGPIKKDSTFFFMAYESLHRRNGRALNSSILTDEARTGFITSCANPPVCDQTKPQTAATTVKVNEDIKPLLPLIPRSNLARPLYESNGNTRWVGTVVDPGKENYGMFRIDQKLSDNDSLFGRFTIDNSDQIQPNLTVVPSGLNNSALGAYRFSAIEYTRVISPTLLNTARVAYNRNNVSTRQLFNASEFPKQVFIMPDPSDPTGYARDALSAGWSSGLTLGNITDGAPNQWVDNTFIYGDTVNWSVGPHSLVLGGNVTRYRMNEEPGTWAFGSLSWANTPSFLQGIIRIAINPITRADLNRGWRQTYGALFLQDDWKATPHLTLNLGLRWERVTAPVEVNGKMGGLVDILRDDHYTTFTDSYFHLRDSLKGFAPRIGFAWTPFGNEKTVFRGAFGIFKEIILEYQYQLAIYVAPWAEKFNLQSPPWPDPIKRATKISAGEPNAMDREVKYPYNMQWNFGIQRQLTNSMVLNATYVGTRSISLVGTANANQFIPIKKVNPNTGQEAWFTPTDAETPNPNYASTRSFLNIGNAWYNSLQVQLQQRFNSGLNYSVSYTFSKNLDSAGIGAKSAETGGSFYTYNLYNVAGDKSLSVLDRRRLFSLNGGYELPFGPGKRFGSNWHGILNVLAGGWQVNGILTAATGTPRTVGSNFDRSHNGTSLPNNDRVDLVAGKSNNPVLPDWTVDKYFDINSFQLQPAGFYGNVGRQTLIGPGSFGLNLSLFKDFSWGEGKNLQFRAETFNFSNTPNFSDPGTTIYNNAAGAISTGVALITSQKNNPRQIQLALKFSF